ncbi:MAG: ATP-binding protein [Candidatus Moraniibacteriota bacterium]
MPKIQITAKGIKSALKKYTPYLSIAEYIWNGFDAQASEIKINYVSDELGNLESFTISDNGYGIDHAKLQEKFEPLFESKKALENKLKKNQSAIHGKNGIGRLTFFCFARNADWKTVFEKAGSNLTYDIYANAENINLYTGISAMPRKSELPTGTEVTFTGIHSLSGFGLQEKLSEFLLKEFAWFLVLNSGRNFSISINDAPLDCESLIAEKEQSQIVHEKSQTVFNLTYVHWNEKSSNETSRYYYLDENQSEKWKETTAIKSKGEQFYHSVFVQSSYFNSFAFKKSAAQENQQPLIAGTRSDSQFRFLQKNLANLLRVKHRPFLKSFAQELASEYTQKNILTSNPHEKLALTIQTLAEIQPRFFTSLNLEQKKFLTNTLNLLLQSNQLSQLTNILNSIVELNPEEKAELEELFNETACRKEA